MKFVQEEILLNKYTTFKIGGAARYFFVAHSVDDIRTAVLFAREKNIPWCVFGEGSNLLVSDEGFYGVVIKIEMKGIVLNETGEGVEVVSEAGEHWDDVVATTVERQLSGFENLSGIPGTVGAAPVQNIGAYGAEIKDTLVWVEALNTNTMHIEHISASECSFAYRDSLFKKPEGRHYIIVRVACLLTSNGVPDISYKDLTHYFAQKKDIPTIADVRAAVLAIRKAKLPDLSVYGTAGSFFKNPVVTTAEYELLAQKFSDMPAFDVRTEAGELVQGQKKIPAAWILDTVCGFKGYRAGNVGVYHNQSLVLVNFGNGTAREINALADMMCACVKKNTHIDLSREVVMLGV